MVLKLRDKLNVIECIKKSGNIVWFSDKMLENRRLATLKMVNQYY